MIQTDTTTTQDTLFLSWYDSYATDIYRYVILRIGTKEVAEDIVSEIFLSAWKHRTRYNPDKASSKTWLFTIAKNALIDHYRKTKPQSELSENIQDGTDLVETTHWNLLSDEIQTALQKLTKEQREIVELRVWHGFSHAEIAQLVAKDERAVRVMFHRSLQSLKKHISPQSYLSFLFFPFLFS